MFQHALIRPHGQGKSTVDAGMVAETLLFYDKVHVAADYELLYELLSVIGPERLLGLIKDGLISVSYSNYRNGVYTDTKNHIGLHFLTSIATTKQANGTAITAKTEIRDMVRKVVGTDARRAKRIAQSLIDLVPIKGGFIESIGKGLAIAHEEFDDASYLRSAVSKIVERSAPSYRLPKSFDFRVAYEEENRFFVLTDLDFTAINAAIRSGGGDHELGPASVLISILEARMDSDLAADYMAELVTKETNSDLIRLRMNNILRRRDRSRGQIDMFQELTFENAKAIREAINSGERTFDDFMPVLDRSRRFKEWLSNQNPDVSLIHEYTESLTVEGWVSTLPGKSVRYVVATVAGVINPAVGLAVAAADEFLIDKWLRGWRPSQFVNGPLRKFVRTE